MPHNISTIDDIRLLRHHLLDKTCKWVWLNQDEVKKHMATFAAQVKDGIVAGRKRKVRSDKGKPRKKRAAQADEEEIEDEHEDEREVAPGEANALERGNPRATRLSTIRPRRMIPATLEEVMRMMMTRCCATPFFMHIH